MNISLCLIVWNEIEGCKNDLPNLPIKDFYEAFAIDGGSKDGTIEFLENHGVKVYSQIKPGLNAAYVQANSLSTGEYIVVFFPKGNLPVDDVLKYKKYFYHGFELVISSRQINSSTNEEDFKWFRPRKKAVLILSYIVSFIWQRDGNRILDVMHGCKGWKVSAFNKMKILDHGLSIDLEMVVRSYKLCIPRIEFPTKENPRLFGSSHFKFWPTGKKLIKYLWFELHRKQ